MRRRDLWAGHITADDYERQMAATGQPQANGDLLAELFRDVPPAPGSRILFAGAGTGQYFDYSGTRDFSLRDIMKQSMTSLRGLLRQNRNYRYTWMAQVVSEVGDYFNNIAVFALVMEKSGSGLVVTGVMLARAIPAVLAGPVAGVLSDRLDRKRIMICSDLVRTLPA